MQITVSGKQVDLSDALRERVSRHLEGIAGKYFDHALEALVTFSRARSFFTCDINLHAGRGLQLRGEGEAADANSAFDDAAEHIAKRLRRYRRRVNDHHRDLANRARPESARQLVLAQDINGVDLDLERAEDLIDQSERTIDEAYATVVAESHTEIASLSLGEAVMRLDLADHMVMMFRNSASGVLNVIYRRPDGHIGWIDPDVDHKKASARTG
jgi:ribosomal subunit interface protein